MSKDPAFLFFPGDYLRDTQCLSEKVQVAYDRIMCEHMRNICISHAQLNFFTKRLSEDEISELKMVLKETENGFQIEWVSNSILKRRAYSESRRKNRGRKPDIICESYDSHMDNENENENRNKKKDTFLTFWKIYPKKRSKGQAEKAWLKIKPDEQLLAKILDSVERAKKTVEWKKDGGEFIPHPATWLNAKGWEDEFSNPLESIRLPRPAILDMKSTPEEDENSRKARIAARETLSKKWGTS